MPKYDETNTTKKKRIEHIGIDLINTIMGAVENFENEMGMRPTIFMSVDLIVVLMNDVPLSLNYMCQTEEGIMFGGYEVKRVQGFNELYIGYRVSVPI